MKVNGEGSHTRPVSLHPDHYTSMLQIIFTLNTKNDSIKVRDLQKIIRTEFLQNMHINTLS